MPYKQATLALEQPAFFNPDNLVVGAANQQAVAILQDWPHWRNPTTILVGAAGSGKSHMAACWKLTTGARQFNQTAFEDALGVLDSGLPILIEDLRPGAFDETLLFHLLNGVQQARLATPTAGLLLTSRLVPSLWKIGLADLASRLKASQLVEISLPDDEMLIAVLTKLFADRQLRVEPQLIRYVASRMERSALAAMRFVDEIDRLALEKKSKINRQLAAQILQQLSKQ